VRCDGRNSKSPSEGTSSCAAAQVRSYWDATMSNGTSLPGLVDFTNPLHEVATAPLPDLVHKVDAQPLNTIEVARIPGDDVVAA
jgi:hypothetical protein